MNDIAERVKFVRKSKNLTQKVFGERLGISQTHISKIEKGIENPSETLLRFISYMYSVDYKWLKTGAGTPKLETGSDAKGSINRYYIFRELFEKPMLSGCMNNDITFKYVNTYRMFIDILTAPSIETLKFGTDIQFYESYYQIVYKLMEFIDIIVENTIDLTENKNHTELDIIKHKVRRTEIFEVIEEEYNKLIDLILKAKGIE